jgi:hypothetical protein
MTLEQQKEGSRGKPHEEKQGRRLACPVNSDASIALGVFYRKEAVTFEEKFAPPHITPQERDVRIKQLLRKSIWGGR